MAISLQNVGHGTAVCRGDLSGYEYTSNENAKMDLIQRNVFNYAQHGYIISAN